MSLSISNAGDSLSERFFTELAPKSSFANHERDPMAPNRRILNTNNSVIVGTLGGICARGAVFSFRDLDAFKSAARIVFADGLD